MALQTSLVDIWNSRPDLQQAFPKGLQGGTQDNANLNNWWNTNGVNEYPNVTLVAPGTPGIQSPSTLTKEAQAGQPPVASPYQPAGQAPGTAPQQQSLSSTSGSMLLTPELRTYLEKTIGGGINYAQAEQKTLEELDARYPGRGILAAGQSFSPQQSPQTNSQTSTGDPKYDALLTQLQGYLDELHKRGQVVNPNVELTPQQIAEFTAKAQAQIDPYFASQLQTARETLLRSQGYNTDEVLQQEQDLERKYGMSVKQIASNAADQGFALSGGRAQDEQNLATDTNNSIQSNRRQLAFAGGNEAINFAQKYGGANIPNPQIQAAPQAVAGQTSFNRSGSSLPFYSLSPSLTDALQNTIGSEQNAQKQAEDTLSSQLQSNYTTQQANNQLRTLQL